MNREGDRDMETHTDAGTELALFRRLASGDGRARVELIDRFEGLAAWVVARLLIGVDWEELLQEARVGLLEAVDRFDYGQGFRFSTYATAVMRRRLKALVAEHHDDGRLLLALDRDEEEWESFLQ